MQDRLLSRLFCQNCLSFSRFVHLNEVPPPDGVSPVSPEEHAGSATNVECSHKGRDPIPIDDASNTRIHNQGNGPGHGLDENQMKLMLLGCPQPPMPLLWLRRKMGVHTPFSLGHCRVVNPSWAFRTAIADHRWTGFPTAWHEVTCLHTQCCKAIYRQCWIIEITPYVRILHVNI